MLRKIKRYFCKHFYVPVEIRLLNPRSMKKTTLIASHCEKCGELLHDDFGKKYLKMLNGEI